MSPICDQACGGLFGREGTDRLSFERTCNASQREKACKHSCQDPGVLPVKRVMAST